MSRDTIRLLICFEARCGSGFLLNILNHQKSVYVEDEWMMFDRRDKFDGDSQASHVRTYFSKETELKGFNVRGFISKVSDIANPSAFISAIRKADLRIIDLRRRNVCKQALSNIRAVDARKKTGKAHAYRKEEVFGSSRVDPARFWSQVKGFEKRLQAQDQFVRQANLPTIQIYYEDLVSDSSVIQAVFAFLELDLSCVTKPNDITLKQTPNRIVDAVENFEEIATIAPTSYHKLLIDR